MRMGTGEQNARSRVSLGRRSGPTQTFGRNRTPRNVPVPRLPAIICLVCAPLGAAGAVGHDAEGSTSLDRRPAAAGEKKTYRGVTAEGWAARYRERTRQLQNVKFHLRRRWRPTVLYSLRLASAASGVPYAELRSVASCESHLFPFATNGRYRGLFQLGWSPFGFSPFDPVANALSAAMTVRRDGSWRQWECKP